MDESPINTINRLKSDLAKLEAKLKESPITEQEPMLKCTRGMYFVDTTKVRCGALTVPYQIIGIEHETRKEAEQAHGRRVQLEIINNHATRLNKETGYIPDWKDWHQTKCYIEFDMRYKKWELSEHNSYMKQTGNVAISPESGKYLVEMLNKGLIKGVNANGDI